MASYLLNCTDEQKAAWLAAAKDAGDSLAEWLRAAADHQVENALTGPGSGAADVDGAGRTAAGLHESVGERQGGQPGPVSASSLRPFRGDPKGKAALEHGSREKAKPTGLCDHRVPRGQFCKRCADA